MSIQTGIAFNLFGVFTKTKLGVAGLTVTVDAWKIVGTTVTEIDTAESDFEVGDGAYGVQIRTAEDGVAMDVIAAFKCADSTLDAQVVYAFQRVGQEGVQNLDAPISGRPILSAITAAFTSSASALAGGSGSKTLTPTDFAALAYTDVVTGDTGTIGPIQANGVNQGNVVVTVSTDLANTDPAGHSVTNAAGMLTNNLNLDPGTYFVTFTLDGIQFPQVRIAIT